MEQRKSQTKYRSSDLAKSAAIAMWVPIERIDTSTNPRRATFLFPDSAQVRRLEQQYDRGELRVEPRQYFDQIRAIKARLYA